jgi:hypothetical protein
MIKRLFIGILFCSVIGTAKAQLEWESGASGAVTGNVADSISALRTAVDQRVDHGTSTANTIPKFSDANTIANSDLLDGTNVISTTDTLASSKAVRTNTIVAGSASDLLIDDNVVLGSASAGANLTVNSTAGTELITNFAGWSPVTNWTYSASKWSHATGSATVLVSDWSPTIGVEYEVVYTLAQSVAGTGVTLAIGGTSFPTSVLAGTYTYRLTASATTSLRFTPGSGGTWVGDITSCSVKVLSNGNITANGITAKGQVLLHQGNATYPSIAFSSMPTTGIYSDGSWSNSIAFSNNGTYSARIGSTYLVLVPTASYFGMRAGSSLLYSDVNYQFDFRNGTNPNILNAYGTWTSATSYERTFVRSTATAGEVGTEHGSAGGSPRPLILYANGSPWWNISPMGKMSNVLADTSTYNLNVTGNTRINTTYSSEMAPALEAVGWTCTDGWSAGSATLVKVAGSGVGTATPSGTFTVVARSVYKVVIVCPAASGSPTYTLGGTTGTTITATTITDYITASTTGKIIFSGASSATCTITSLSVTLLNDGVGDQIVMGNLKVASQIEPLEGPAVSGGVVPFAAAIRTYDAAHGYYLSIGDDRSKIGLRIAASSASLVKVLDATNSYADFSVNDIIINNNMQGKDGLCNGEAYFCTNASADTVAISGAATTDVYTFTWTSAPGATAGNIYITRSSSGFIVTTAGATTGNPSYMWTRRKKIS